MGDPAPGPAPDPVDVVGVHGGEVFGAAAAQALDGATVLMGARRHLDALDRRGRAATARRVDLGADMGAALKQAAAARQAGERVCIAVSGDPGFFGLVRLARHRLGPGGLRIHPAPPSVSLAFAAAGTHWDDAVVVSVHGRDAGTVAEAVHRHPKVAVLCSPATPPEEVGRLVLSAAPGSAAARDVVVAARLGEDGEQVWRGDVAGLAAGRFDPLAVVVMTAPDRAGGPAGWAWGRPEAAFEHREGMITKAEVRAVAMGKLAVPAAGVLWDVGAGSGSVSAEVAALAPGLAVYAVERRDDDLPALRRNLEGTAAVVVAGEAPGCLRDLPDPDRVFVGGGGMDVLDVVLGRLRPGGRVVATYASIHRATAAADRLGRMVQVSVSRAVPVGPDASLRLAAENPVFVCWGPEDR